MKVSEIATGNTYFNGKDSVRELLLQLQAKKTKLSPGEQAYMQSAMDEAGGAITAGTHIQFDHMEGRAVSGLVKKGLVVRHKGEVEVTLLGEAWFRSATQSCVAN